ncbi:MAG: hypothetical protein AAF797_06340 [Planctomycetota bacterium]
MTILLFNLPASEPDRRFLTAVAGACAAVGVRLVVANPKDRGDGLELVPTCFELPKRTVARGDESAAGVEEAVLAQCRYRGVDASAEEVPGWRRGAAALAAAQGVLLDELRPALCLFWNGYFPSQPTAIAAAKARGIPVAYVERAPLPGFVYLDRDGLMADSALRRRLVAEREVPASDRALEAYAAVRLAIVEQGQTWWAQSGEAAEDPWGDEVERVGRVLFAGQVDNDTQNYLFSPHFAGGLEAVSAFAGLAAERGVSGAVGKHHPMADVTVEALAEAFEPAGRWLDGLPLDGLLRRATHVAGVNSGVLFEAMLQGKPVLTMGRTLLSGVGCFYEWGPGEEGVMEGWLAGDELELRVRRFEHAVARCLEDGFYGIDGLGLNGAEAFVDRLVSWCDPARSAGTAGGGLPRYRRAFRRVQTPRRGARLKWWLNRAGRSARGWFETRSASAAAAGVGDGRERSVVP